MNGQTEKIIEYLSDNKSRSDAAAAFQNRYWLTREGPPPLLFADWDEPFPLGLGAYDNLEIFESPEKMFASELGKPVASVTGGMQAAPSVRANMGCGIYPTLFGVKQMRFADKMPWLQEHLPKQKLSRMEPAAIKLGDEFKQGLEYMARFAMWLEDTGCRVYPMDLQSPFNIAHMVYGDEIFYELYDDPPFARHLIGLACEAVFLGMDACLSVIPGSDAEVAHYGALVIPRSLGGLKLSEDTSTLLSEDMIGEFVVPYADKVLSRYGGGYVHYCGRNDFLLEAFLKLPSARGINFGNPEKHEMDDVLRRCAKHGKIYYGPVNRGEGETLSDYFARCVKNASMDGKSHLVLTFDRQRGSATSRDEIIEAWNAGVA